MPHEGKGSAAFCLLLSCCFCFKFYAGRYGCLFSERLGENKQNVSQLVREQTTWHRGTLVKTSRGQGCGSGMFCPSRTVGPER